MIQAVDSLRTEEAIPEYRYLMDGHWTRSQSGRTIDLKSPLDDAVVGRIQAMTVEEVDRACKSCSQAWPKWNEKTVDERAQVLHRAADLMSENKDLLRDLLIREVAKNRKEAEDEVLRTAALIHYFAEEGRRYYGEVIFGDSFPGYKKDKMALVYREPWGVVLAISPFNYPLNLSASKIAPALITGNSVLFKPAQLGAISALHMSDMFLKAGVPPGVLNVITGSSKELGDPLVCHPDIGMIAFTGGTKTGYHIAKVAAIVPMMLELGGKDAAIVLSDCDLPFTAKQIVSGAFSYSGQRCTAVKRILVEESFADTLIEAVLPLVKALKLGDPREQGMDLGPVVSDETAKYVQALIDDALGKGARLLCGNESKGRYMSPTVLDRVTEEMSVAWEEPFGPVLPILRVSHLDEAIRIANKSEYGLQSSVFTQDVDKAMKAARKLEVGSVQINGKDSRGPDHFPFLGWKASGMGTQGVHYSITAMTRTKSVVLNLRD
ncbi:MAG: NADP-dependent glyceraldehyde-3-phosphate dehydrogenase [Armatimonadetes bacterium]|nr:NADP-dependent glyceraldehyde-3-phosphate dehydrogenase [Armatimonadota bacterium]